MCVVRKERPTWYAAVKGGVELDFELEIEKIERRTIHPPKAFARNHLEVDALVAVLGVHEMRQLDGVAG